MREIKHSLIYHRCVAVINHKLCHILLIAAVTHTVTRGNKVTLTLATEPQTESMPNSV